MHVFSRPTAAVEHVLEWQNCYKHRAYCILQRSNITEKSSRTCQHLKWRFELHAQAAICVFAGSSFSMTGKYSDRAAQEYLILLMMKRNFAGAVSSSTNVSGECFHVVHLRKLIWIYSFLAAGNFTGQNIRQSQLVSDCAHACYIINGKKMLIMFVGAGLTLTPRAQVYLCLRCYHKFMREKERILIFSTYDEFKHPSIFGVCALLLILSRINKRRTLLISSHFVFCSVFFIK